MTHWKKSDYFKAAITATLLLAMLALFVPFYTETLLAGVFGAWPSSLDWAISYKPNTFAGKISVAGILAGMFAIVAAPISMVAYKSYIYFSRASRRRDSKIPKFSRSWFFFRSQLLKFANQVLHTLHLENQIDLAGLSEEALNDLRHDCRRDQHDDHLPAFLKFSSRVFVFNVALYFFLAEARMIKSVFLRIAVSAPLNESEKVLTALQKACSYNTVVTSISLGAMAATIVSVGSLFLSTPAIFAVVWVVTFFCSFYSLLLERAPWRFPSVWHKLVLEAYGEAVGLLVSWRFSSGLSTIL